MMSLYNVIRLHIAELYENEQELKALQKEKPHYKEYFAAKLDGVMQSRIKLEVELEKAGYERPVRIDGYTDTVVNEDSVVIENGRVVSERH
ncbi:hypothetical protein J4N45_10440 [Vibrio sp. SCSIO 43140]|uniref:hypothetical protein n=1 Tax=Vibrio sp. SCSIO 43140 TaxID=2819100 RepID=UPI002074F9EB|nr:hypothetical protein [Vibrio sp. SCSIO 43140]USD58948.1 hypothetical protein J4N45_10440 [Vibrio sp. SCSIO 43140]